MLLQQVSDNGEVLLLQQVRSDNDAPELDILGHLKTFWDNSEDFGQNLQ